MEGDVDRHNRAGPGQRSFPWPLSLQPGRLVIANPDVFGNAWTLAWIVHQTFTNPLRLYDANIYWPIPGVLGLTETQFPQALLASPILAAGGDAVLAHNVVVLLSFRCAGSRPICWRRPYRLPRRRSPCRADVRVLRVPLLPFGARAEPGHAVAARGAVAIRRALATRAIAWSFAASVLFAFAILGSATTSLITVFAVGTLLLTERAWRN